MAMEQFLQLNSSVGKSSQSLDCCDIREILEMQDVGNQKFSRRVGSRIADKRTPVFENYKLWTLGSPGSSLLPPLPAFASTIGSLAN
jgi:hypothetical protein